MSAIDRLRRVKKGDVISEDDHNTKVDVVNELQQDNKEIKQKAREDPDINTLMAEIDAIIARMRRVKFGDYVLADDHNLFVDFAQKQKLLNEEFKAQVGVVVTPETKRTLSIGLNYNVGITLPAEAKKLLPIGLNYNISVTVPAPVAPPVGTITTGFSNFQPPPPSLESQIIPVRIQSTRYTQLIIVGFSNFQPPPPPFIPLFLFCMYLVGKFTQRFSDTPQQVTSSPMALEEQISISQT